MTLSETAFSRAAKVLVFAACEKGSYTMLKEKFYDNNHMYVAVLENDTFIIAYEDGTATDLNGNRYQLISHLDENNETITDDWQLIN